MVIHIKDLPKDHKIWKLINRAVLSFVGDDPESDEHVCAMGVCSDFLWTLSDNGRLRAAGEVYTVNYAVTIDTILANDSILWKAVTKHAREYSYSTVFDEPPAYITNMHCITRLYTSLIESGYIAFYERQVLTTEKCRT